MKRPRAQIVLTSIKYDRHHTNRPCRYTLAKIGNIKEIARAISRPAEYVLRFICYELRTFPVVDPQDGNWCLDAPELTAPDKAQAIVDSIIDSFVRQFVKCRACSSFDTSTSAMAGKVNLYCNTCNTLSSIARTEHGVLAFIYKQLSY